MKATAELDLVAVETEWDHGREYKTLVLIGEGVTLRIEIDDTRTAQTLMKRYPKWTLVLGVTSSGHGPQSSAVSPDGASTAAGVSSPETSTPAAFPEEES